MTSQTGSLERTALYDEHARLGARLVPYAGFEMPVQYAGILQEHDAVRNRAGLFDLSHMGQFELDGDRVAEWADTLATNAVATMKPMQARYNIFCNERGGTHDDTIFYRLDGRWLLVVNAANAAKMWTHLAAHAPAGRRAASKSARLARAHCDSRSEVGGDAAAARRRRPGGDEILLLRGGPRRGRARRHRSHRLHG